MFMPSSSYWPAVRLFLTEGFELNTRAILDKGSCPTLLSRQFLSDHTQIQPLGEEASMLHDVNGGCLSIVGPVCLRMGCKFLLNVQMVQWIRLILRKEQNQTVTDLDVFILPRHDIQEFHWRDFRAARFIVCRRTLRLDTSSFRAPRGPERGSVQSQCTHSCTVRAGRTNRTHLRRWWHQRQPHIRDRTRLFGSHSHRELSDCSSTPLSAVKRGRLSTTCTKYALLIVRFNFIAPPFK